MRKYNTLNTVFYTFREVGHKDPLSILLYTVYIILRLFSGLLAVWFLPSLISCVEEGMGSRTIIFRTLFFVLAMFIFHAGATLMNQLYWPRMSNVRVKFSQDLDERMLRMPYAQFEDPSKQDEFQNANNVINTTREGIAGVLITSLALVEEVLSFVIYIVASLTVHYGLFLMILVSVIINYFYTEKTNRKNYDNTVKMNTYDRQLLWLGKAMSEETYGKDIRLYGMAPWLFSRLAMAYQDKMNLYQKNLLNNRKLSFLNVFSTLVCDLGIYFVLLVEVFKGILTVSQFSLHFSIIHKINGLIKNIMQYTVRLQKYTLSMNDYRKVVNTYAKESKEKVGKQRNVLKDYQITFEGVSFQYPNTDTYVLQDLSFSLEAGEKLSLVGENGAGKSTIVKLLCRMYKPTNGKILLGGKDIWEYTEDEYQKLISVVFQDTVVYGFSIAENVSMRPEPDSNMEKVTEALYMAGVLDKINSFPEGVHSKLVRRLHDDAVDLSGGEKQKIAIARALYKNSPVMILDEPTAALDAFMENKIYQTFDEMTNGKTAIFISHRLASAKFCSKIMMLQNGRILDIGTHTEMLERCSVYRELYRIQASGYTAERI